MEEKRSPLIKKFDECYECDDTSSPAAFKMGAAREVAMKDVTSVEAENNPASSSNEDPSLNNLSTEESTEILNDAETPDKKAEDEKEEDDDTFCIFDAYENIKILSCGHAFHAECIAGWERGSTLCPICKQPQAQTLDESGNAGETGGVRRGGDVITEVLESNAQAQGTRRSWGQRHYWRNELALQDDYRFRLTRVQHYYPDYVTSNLVSRAVSGSMAPGYSGSIVSDVDFVRSHPNYQSSVGGRSGGGSSGSSGGWGGGSSFGGGSSGGGGGSGGSW